MGMLCGTNTVLIKMDFTNRKKFLQGKVRRPGYKIK